MDAISISIIVPVYNVEEYIVRCINSILDQEYSGSFEVIAVDDGSTDNSLKILKSYSGNEKVTIVEHGSNKMLSKTRSTGMKLARSQYIMHVDSDDWLLPNALNTLNKVAQQTNADVIVYNYVRGNGKDNIQHVKEIGREKYSVNKFKLQKHFRGSVWNKIVKKSLTEEMIYFEQAVNNTEDLIYSTEILCRAASVYLIPDYLYCYFENSNSLTHKYNSTDFIRTQKIIITQLEKIFATNSTGRELTSSIINYFDKWIYLHLGYDHLRRGGIPEVFPDLVMHLNGINSYSRRRLNRLQLSIKSFTLCFLEIILRFGPRYSFGMIKSVIKKST
jgi:glycosyltransferase involved in cell wall biosynthesis